MAKWIAILDMWLLMIICNSMVLFAAASSYGLTRGHGTGSWDAILLCLVAASITACMIAWFARAPSRGQRRVLLLTRILFVAVLAWLLWFQSRPWLGLRDWESTNHEVAVQRIEQFAIFLVFTAAFVGLGHAHSTTMPISAGTWPQTAVRRSLVVIVTLGLILPLIVRWFGASHPESGAIGALVVPLALAVMLLEFARRAARVERAVFGAFAAVTIGVPLILFWP
jgi:hypothetical protein